MCIFLSHPGFRAQSVCIQPSPAPSHWCVFSYVISTCTGVSHPRHILTLPVFSLPLLPPPFLGSSGCRSGVSLLSGSCNSRGSAGHRTQGPPCCGDTRAGAGPEPVLEHALHVVLGQHRPSGPYHLAFRVRKQGETGPVHTGSDLFNTQPWGMNSVTQLTSVGTALPPTACQERGCRRRNMGPARPITWGGRGLY